MKQPIKYLWGEKHLQIQFGNRTEPRIRMLYYTEFLFTAGMATIFLMESFSTDSPHLHWIISSSVFLLYLLAAYRLLSRLLLREEIIITEEQFIIVNKTPFSCRRISYDWEALGSLHYGGKGTKTDHPLKGSNFDYFGFDTQEHLIQNLHHDGNLFFNHLGKPVRFARGIYSWHAEELIHMIRLFAGTALQLGAEWKYLLQEMEWE